MSHKILVSDPISEDGLQSILKHPEFDVDIQTDLSENDLVNMISTYDALIVRSQTQVTERIINAATNLKVIARAGVGVDNINIEAATLKGILVINALMVIQFRYRTFSSYVACNGTKYSSSTPIFT